MAFKFTLATVLRVRQIAEEREERVLQRIQQEIANVLQSIAQAETAIAESNLARHTQIKKTSRASIMHLSYGELRLLQQNRADLNEQLSSLEVLKQNQFKLYLAARRNCEMLLSVRDDLQSVYESEMSRREQSALDDNYVARLIYGSPEN